MRKMTKLLLSLTRARARQRLEFVYWNQSVVVHLSESVLVLLGFVFAKRSQSTSLLQ